jgi:neutral ceramidase
MDTLHCGAGKADITLPAGTPMGGFANRPSTCQGALDPLSARVLLLTQGQRSSALVALDALAINVQRAGQLCKEAAGVASSCATSIDPADMRIICSHTHSGADLSGMFGDAERLEAYSQLVTAATRQACGSMAPAKLTQAVTQLPIGRNRRLRPGHAQVTELERAQGAEIDHILTVLRFEQATTGRPSATLFHSACHPVCLGPENVLASGDFAGAVSQWRGWQRHTAHRARFKLYGYA